MSGGSPAGPALRARAPLALISLAVVALDQATKAAVIRLVDPHEAIPVIPGFLEITHVLNTGGVWGLGSDFPEAARLAVFLALPALITVFAAWYSWKLPASDRLRQVAIALVVGGAVGNLIDRLTLRHVVDFVHLHVGERYWPAFNVADSCICLGVGILLVGSFREEPEDEAPALTGR